MKKLTLLTFATLFIIVSLTAQVSTPNFYRLTNNEGLSQASANVIFKDSEGFLWIGTDDGLNRFDGKNVKTYYYKFNDTSTISANEVYGICEDRLGRIWVSHFNGGISCFDKRTSKFKRLSTIDKGKPALSSNRIYGIYCDRQGFVWARSVLGMSRIDPRNFSVSNHDDQSINDVSTANVDIAETSSYIWFGGKQNGLLRITRSGSIIPFHEWDISKYGAAVFGIYSLDRNSMLVSSNKGLFKVAEVNNKVNVQPLIFDTLFYRSSKLFKEKKSDKVWVATDINGVLIVDVNKGKIIKQIKSRSIKDNLVSNTIFDLFEDEEQNVFIATDRGVNIFSPYNSIFNNYENIFRHFEDFGHPVYAVHELDDGNILIGSKYRGAYFLNPRTLDVKHTSSAGVKNADKLTIYHFCPLKTNEVLVATSDGLKGMTTAGNGILHELHGYPEIKVLDSFSVTDVVLVNDTTGWISTIRNGVFKWNLKEHTLKQYQKNDLHPNHGPVDNQVLDISLTTEKNIGLSTKYGFSIYYPSVDTFQNFFPGNNFPHELPARNIKSSYDDGKNIWISTYGAGVQIWNKRSKTFRAITRENGLPNEAVYSVIPDTKNRVWIATNNGLAAFNAITGDVNVYTSQDGLPDNEFNAYSGYRSKSGLIFFSTINGIVSIDPSRMTTNHYHPNTVLTQFRASNSEKDTNLVTYKTREYNVPPGFNSVLIKFAALSYAAPGKNLYKVKLEGFDEDWLYLNNETEIRYTQLPPGKYVFKIQATNNSRNWNNNIFSVNVNVRPFWYQTWWFKMLMVMTALGVLYLSYLYRISQILQVENLRRKISSDLHDDIGSTLSSINIYSELAKNETDNHHYINTIQQHTQSTITSLDDLVWSINPNNDTLSVLIDRMRSFCLPLLQAKNITTSFSADISDMDIKISVDERRSIYLAFKEIITNVLKHAESTHCAISIIQKGRSLTIEVQDNGKGFDIEKLNPQRNGIAGLKHRAKQHHGYYEVKTAPGKGASNVFKVNI